MADIFDEVGGETKTDIFDQVMGDAGGKTGDIFDEVMGSAPSPTPGIPRSDTTRDPATFAPGTPSWKRKKPLPIKEQEAVWAAGRLALDDEALAAVIAPDAPDKVLGHQLQEKREQDYALASTYIGNEAKLRELSFKPSSAPKLPTAPSDATAVAPVRAAAPQEIPTPVLTPKPLATGAPADVAAVDAAKPAEAERTAAVSEAKLVERAQTLAEALPSAGKGFVKGVTAGAVDAPEGGGIPGAVGQVAGSLVGGVGSALAGPAGPPAFLMTQFLNDLMDRGMDPAKMTDPEILALAATSGLMGGLTPVAFGAGTLKRALTGAGLQGSQNLAEEEIIAAVTETEPERLKAMILGGAFGAGFGAAFRKPAVRAAVEAKLAPEEVKVLDEAVGGEVPELAPKVPEDAAQVPEQARPPESSTPEIAPKVPAEGEIGAEAPVPAAVEAPVVAQPEAAAPDAAPSLTPEAVKVLDDLDASGIGVPKFMTRNLRKIAEENGLEFKPEMTPNDVIEGLKAIQRGEVKGRTPDAAPPPTERGDDEAVRLWREKRTASPYFRKWFGESKVVDADGKPKVVYHKTTKDFDDFDLGKFEGGEVRGAYFSGEGDGSLLETATRSGEGESVYPVYLDIKNPADYADMRASMADLPTGWSQEQLKDALIARGFDGVINDEFKGTEYIVFSPKQVKSATGNSGRFDPSSPSITDRIPFGRTPEGVVRAPDPDERYTSAKKAFTTKDRAEMGLDEIPSPARATWADALEKARDTEADAQTLAKTIIEKPRALDDIETAAMVRRMVTLKNQHEAALDSLAKTEDPILIDEQSVALRKIEEQFDEVSEATIRSGTEKGRNLAIQKLTLNKKYDLLSIKTRAKAAKKKPLTADEEAKFKDLHTKLKEADTKLVDAEARIKAMQATDAIQERRRSARATKKNPNQTKATIADLTEKTRRLLRAGCLTS